jgi:hypothetical protein
MLPHLPALGALAGGAVLKAALHLDCPFQATTGLLCPACGTTRACLALARGQVGAAAGANLLFVALLSCAAVWLAVPSVRRALRSSRVSDEWLTYLGVAAMLAFAVLRNLPALSDLRPST